ncbi:FG-GAP-like repeat-containing protein [Algoriphagus terrigena]|uniref:FG-GAP-like repeat-containing protein n=1 Tax=Algoriphagus terrigena TaxID=344884 RepID=UPI00040BA8CF|nr:FG-GAP-like repeat-containing protein [Algoriphagus terrigena]
MSKTLTLLFTLIFSQAFSQAVFKLDSEKSIQVNGGPVSIPFSQGINSAQIQTIDLTGDGKEEWVIWDINSGQLQVFAKEGESFQILPELAYYFPAEVSGFLVLVDFDGDGKKDLFTSTPLGIRAYRNTSQGSQISWTLAQNFLKLDGANNIPANNLDTPLLQDLDGDGDLDLVLFNFAQGDFLEFFRNTSVERKGTPDIDGFAFPVDYWGDFVFCGCGDFAFGKRCDESPIDFRINPDENDRILHAGGHSILYRDFSGDGIPDLLLGRDECNTLYFLPNSGTSDQPKFTEFSTSLPSFGELPNFPRFHIGQLIDEQLVISLNTNEASANYGIDFAHSVATMDANGSGSSPILQDQLFDLGENVRPLFQGNSLSGELWLASNLKTSTDVLGQATRLGFSGETFTLFDTDFLGLSSLGLLDIQLIDYTSRQGPHFQLASGTKTLNSVPTPIIYRVQGANLAEFSLAGLTLRVGDQLTFFPFEGKDHLLVAAQNGSLTLYEVDLKNLNATLKTANFLDFQDNPANRNLSVAVTLGDKPDLYSADQTGRIFLIQDFMNSETREEVLVKIGDQNLTLQLGRNTWITTVNPALGSQVDLILGSRGGGILYLKSASSDQPDADGFQTKIYPNPTSGPFSVVSNFPATGRLISTLGQIILEEIEIPANQVVEIQAQTLSPGVYILQLESENREVLTKKILIR